MAIGGDADFGPDSPGGTGLVTVADQGLVSVTGNATVYGAGTIHLNGGSLQAALVNLLGGTLAGQGDVIGNVSNAGLVSPGNSPGAITVHGDYSQMSAGTLAIGLFPTGFDQLHITGAAHLGGTLTVSLSGGFVPAPGTTYDLLSATSINGMFAALDLPTLPGGELCA